MDQPVLPIALKASNLRPVAYRVLTKKYGLNIQSSALDVLSVFIGRTFGQEWRGPSAISFLEQVGRMWKAQNRGLFVNGEGVDAIIRELTGKNAKKPKQKSQTIDDSLRQQSSFDVYADTQEMESADEDEDEAINWRDYFKVINVARYRSVKFDVRRKVLEVLKNDESVKISLPTAEDAITLHTNKFLMMRDRLLRNEHFQPTTFSSVNSITGSFHPELETQQIMPIKNLLGRHGQRFTLFGLLTVNAMGLWQLQDNTDAIVLELGQCMFPKDCFLTAGNYIVCEGIYSNSGKFYVSSMTPPPPEEREASLDALGNVDVNGIYTSQNGRIDTALRLKMPLVERDLGNHRMLFLGGDIHLNDLKVLEALKKLFASLTEQIETKGTDLLTIVLPGSFVDKPLDVTGFSAFAPITSSGLYKSYFDSFAAILEKFPKVCQTAKFVILPGDKDPWMSMVTKDANSVWPKFRIPAIFGSRLGRWVRDISWASNPCKMNYLAHDITIVRDDLGARFQRNDMTYVSKKKEGGEEDEEEEDPDILEIDRMTKPKLAPELEQARKVVKSLLDQADLSPFTQQTRPIMPNYWSLMSLLPLPDLLVLVDTTTPHFDLIYENCHVLNPGKFLEGGKINYMEYTPATRKAHYIQLRL